MSFLETELGFEFSAPNYFVFFGKKDSSVENLQRAYPQFTFKTLWQVHVNELHHTLHNFENNSVKADAHWTEEQNLALISKSADCIPVLAYCHIQKKILAIHAGWRGVQNQIIPKSLAAIGSNWDLFIGPHITKQSFEVQQDCVDLLKIATKLDQSRWLKDNKVDLLKIVIEQIESSRIKDKKIETLIFDTKSDQRFHSFRRDKELAGRQNSFIVKMN